MRKSPESVGHLNMSTHGEQYERAKAKVAEARDAEWDDPSDDNTRMVHFWEGQMTEHARHEADEPYPLF